MVLSPLLGILRGGSAGDANWIAGFCRLSAALGRVPLWHREFPRPYPRSLVPSLEENREMDSPEGVQSVPTLFSNFDWWENR